MTAAKLMTIILILFLVCLKIGHSGVKKIKIHVPYYVKHVHHFKKVYVPKIHVIKHEHHHKKEYDHHHHHHEIYKRPYKSYDKSSHEYPDEFLHHDFYYDDIESKSFRTHSKRKTKPWKLRLSGSEQYYGWKDVDGGDYKSEDSGEEDDDYTGYKRNYYFKRRADTVKNDSKEEPDEPDEEEEGDEVEEEEEVEEPGIQEGEKTEEDTDEEIEIDSATDLPNNMKSKIFNSNSNNNFKNPNLISITSTTQRTLR